MGCVLDKDIIVIDDNYTGQVKQNYLAAGEKLDGVVNEYVGVLRELVEEEGISGKAAEKVLAFADLAESLLKEIMSDWLGQIAGQMEQYVAEIDIADAEIY